MTARIAASFISSGSGHSSPRAFALSTTVTTVAVEHPHENAMFLMLIPMALCLRISLYLTISFSFSLDGQGRPSRPSRFCWKRKRPLRGACQFFSLGCISQPWNTVAAMFGMA